MKTFKTPKGTELPLLNLKGKEYLQVQHRIIWFREEHPDWSVETEFLLLTADSSVAKATIRDEKGKIIAQGTKSETKQGFPDHIEKAESGAIGRALALCGYGTQFAQELEEGERIVDSPAPTKSFSVVDPGSYVLKVGKQKGMRLDACDIYALDSFAGWIKAQPDPSSTLLETFDYVDAFLKTREVKKQ